MRAQLGENGVMKETRQQRRARERAERKAARRGHGTSTPRTAPAPVPPKSPHVLEVQLSRFHFPGEEEPVTWSAEWGLRDDSVGTEDSNEDVQQLVNDIVEDARRWADRYDLTIEWTLSGDTPRGKTIEDILRELSVTLPGNVAR